MVTDLTVIESGVWTITADTPVEDIADVMGKLEWLIRRAKEVKDELESRMVEKIQAHGEFVIGEVRYYVGNPKKVKCQSNADTLNAMLAYCGGDVERLSDCLASDAWKYGTVRTLLEEAGKSEVYDLLFETTTEPELKEGKPLKRLMKHNPAFSG
jgi:hypothetical protein